MGWRTGIGDNEFPLTIPSEIPAEAQTNATSKGRLTGALLIDSDGAVVGIVFARSNDRQDSGYALASNEIIEFLDSVDPSTVADRGRCR